jgi:hypothetical protein
MLDLLISAVARCYGQSQNMPISRYFVNGANRDRTGDLLLAKQALSQLSYGPRAPFYGLLAPLAGRAGGLWKRYGNVRVPVAGG